ncbi:hypothetical protein FKM82_024446 [Ascaphus truei]
MRYCQGLTHPTERRVGSLTQVVASWGGRALSENENCDPAVLCAFRRKRTPDSRRGSGLFLRPRDVRHTGRWVPARTLRTCFPLLSCRTIQVLPVAPTLQTVGLGCKQM